MRICGVLLGLVLLGCVSSVHRPADLAAPAFDPIAFFAGKTHGEGVLKIAFHHPDHVAVDGTGRMETGDTIVLDQIVRRGNRAPTHRTWRLTPVAPGHFAGTLSDAEGPVSGEAQGNRLHLAFRMKGGLRAQQWLSLAADGQQAGNVLIVSKFGLPVARLDETIRRLP